MPGSKNTRGNSRSGSAAKTTPGKKRKRASWIVWAKRVALGLVGVALAGLLGLSGVFWYYGRNLPTVATLKNYQPPQTTRVVDRNGVVLGEIFTERRTVVPLERVPRVLVLSVLAAEDADFFRHQGLDYPGIVRALSRDVLSGRATQGASTITQQIIKLMLLSPERTLSRKIRELILARRLEQELTKEEILHLYLNHINFGHGRYGVQEAARYYFGKDVDQLTLAEASLIAGIPQAPGRLSPRTHPEAARRRQRFVLDQLEAKRAEYWPDLSLEQIEAARQAEIALAPTTTATDRAPEIVAIAKRILLERVGEESFARGGYTVHTTIDVRLQDGARTAVQRRLAKLDERHGYRGPLEPPRREQRRRASRDPLRVGRTFDAEVTGANDESGEVLVDVAGTRGFFDTSEAGRYNPRGLSASRFAKVGARARVAVIEMPTEDEPRAHVRLELGPEAAAVVIEPRTRDVLAMIGGYEASAGFNRATQAVRQPGSAFKPIVYALGIKSRRFTPASIVLDAPAVYDQWQPNNFETYHYEGAMRLRDALARSINVVAVRVIEELTPTQTISFARQLGLTTELEDSLALALGASDVKPIELVNAYATFAAGGRFVEPRIVDRIVAYDGTRIGLGEVAPPRDVMTAAEAYMMTSLLSSVVESGTATAARELDRPAAGKTGTSNEARDAWFVGYTADVVAGVWVGFDDRRSLGSRETGAIAALPIWIDIVRAASEGKPARELARPSGVVTARIDPATGLLANEGQENAIDEVFLDGTAPTETAPPADVADTSSFLMEQFGAPPSPTPPPE